MLEKDNENNKLQYKVVVNHEEQYSIWPADNSATGRAYWSEFLRSS
jgi:uncharacterized protein YbdZ (MbtH family)